MNWKLERDSFYGPLAKRYGREFVDEAGFFEDTDDRDAPLDDTRLLCTPIGVVASNLEKSSKPPAVIVSTGAFCPVHQGHLDLMEVAKVRVEEAGYSVIGGYLSPGHDEYLRLKLGEQALSSPSRLAACGEAVKESKWLMVDPWEALYRRVAVNFTDVIARLATYLLAHLGNNISVFYAFGSDNARFSLTFALRGHAVVVERPGYEDAHAQYREHPLNRANPRVLWTQSARKVSSTEIRKAAKALVSPAAHPKKLSLRCEEAVVAPGSARAWAEFQRGLCSLMGRWFDVGKRGTRTWDLNFELPVISLDPLTAGDHAISISRLYDLGGYTQRGYAPRPGAEAFASQVRRIPPGDYVLVDDDICSGGTVHAVRSLLPEGSRIVETRTAVEAETGAEWQEVADSRDFLLGAADAGLVMSRFRGETVRGIYAYPYVDPAIRCSVPSEDALDFSIEVWRLNAKFYQQCPCTVSSIGTHQRSLLLMAGFQPEDELSNVCEWHLDTLEDLRRPGLRPKCGVA